MRFRAVAITCLVGTLAGLFGSSTAFAMSSDEEEATFWKVAVVDFAGRTPFVEGPSAAVRVAASLRNSKRFHVIDPKSVRRGITELGVDVKGGKIDPSDAKKLCKKLRIDGIFVGRIDKGAAGNGVLTLGLHSGSSGRLFAQYRFNITPQFPLAEAEKVALSYTTRLPYDGLVVSVRRDLALINLGSANGIGNGSKVYSFAFDSVKRDANSVVTGGDRKALAELEVVRAEQHGSWVRPLKGEMPEQFAKISLRPVAGSAELKPMVVTERAIDLPFKNMEVDVDVAFLLKSYELTGEGQQFTSDTTLFPAPGLRLEYFQTRVWGGTLRVRHGFIPFRREVPGTGTIQTFAGSITTVSAEGHARKIFGGTGHFAGGSVDAGLGLHYAMFKIDDQNPRVLTNDTYIGPIVSGRVDLPLLEKINVHGRLAVVPFAAVSEEPVDNGGGRALGVGGTVGLDYHINEKLFVSFNYGAESMQTTFPSGGGSRNILSPKSTDLYHGVTMTLGWRNYR